MIIYRQSNEKKDINNNEDNNNEDDSNIVHDILNQMIDIIYKTNMK